MEKISPFSNKEMRLSVKFPVQQNQASLFLPSHSDLNLVSGRWLECLYCSTNISNLHNWYFVLIKATFHCLMLCLGELQFPLFILAWSQMGYSVLFCGILNKKTAIKHWNNRLWSQELVHHLSLFLSITFIHTYSLLLMYVLSLTLIL